MIFLREVCPLHALIRGASADIFLFRLVPFHGALFGSLLPRSWATFCWTKGTERSAFALALVTGVDLDRNEVHVVDPSNSNLRTTLLLGGTYLGVTRELGLPMEQNGRWMYRVSSTRADESWQEVEEESQDMLSVMYYRCRATLARLFLPMTILGIPGEMSGDFAVDILGGEMRSLESDTMHLLGCQ